MRVGPPGRVPRRSNWSGLRGATLWSNPPPDAGLGPGSPQIPTAFPFGAAAISMTPAPAGRVDSGHGQRLWTTPVDNGGVVHTSV